MHTFPEVLLMVAMVIASMLTISFALVVMVLLIGKALDIGVGVYDRYKERKFKRRMHQKLDEERLARRSNQGYRF